MSKQSLTYEEFKKQYEWHLNDRCRPWEKRDIELKKIVAAYPKMYSRYMLLTGFGSLVEGSTVYIVQRKRSRTGYSRTITIYSMHNDPEYGIRQANLTWHVGRLMNYTVRDYEGYQVLRTDDYPQEFVAHLSQLLFGIDKSNMLRCEVL